MFLRFDNLVVLFGLFALAVPILLHLLQRRRFEVINWGAMQFLPDSVVAQRRRWLDEVLLMLVRMGLIALIVLGLATPISTSGWLDGLTGRPTRDIVLVLDGSYSMDVRLPSQPTPWEDAIRAALADIDDADAGARFAIVIARQPPHVVLEDFSGDRDEMRARVRALPAARGNPDMPGALAEAWKLLQGRSRARAAEIRVFTDQQRHGWADPANLAALDSLGSQWRSDIERARTEGGAIPTLRVVKVGSELPNKPSNYALAPLAVARGVARVGQKLMIQGALQTSGIEPFVPPRKLRAFIDGQAIEDLALPEKLELKQGEVPLVFSHIFKKEGQYVVSFIVEADPARDALKGDNEQHAVIDVVKELPILLVDGDRQLGSESSSFFLQQALASKDETIKNTVVVPSVNLKPETLFPDRSRPAVIVLADVPKLDASQLDALDRFLAEGGGLFIALGERAAREHAFYNQQPWLPAKLTGVGAAKEGVYPEAREFQHPALALLRDSNMAQVRFGQWTRVQLAPEDRAAATLSNGAPLLIEKPYKRGRVMLSSVPMDRSWGSTFPSQSEYPILMHELMHYLAGISAGAGVLDKGEPIRLSPGETSASQLTLKTPEVDGLKFDIKQWPWTFRDTGAIGVYQARLAEPPSGRAWSYVVRPDLAESDLTRSSDEDWRWVQARLPIAWQTASAPSSADADTPRVEMWWMFLLTVLGLLCVEVWLTRRMVLGRGP
jgi:hypothetical protein